VTQPYGKSPEARMEAAFEKGLLRDADETPNELLITAREIAANTTMMVADAEAWLSGSWDESLPRVIRQIANHSLKTIEVRNRERGIGT
jgi:hypothetical protein